MLQYTNIQTSHWSYTYCRRHISISNLIENPIMHLANGYISIMHVKKTCFFFFPFFLLFGTSTCYHVSLARQYLYRPKRSWLWPSRTRWGRGPNGSIARFGSPNYRRYGPSMHYHRGLIFGNFNAHQPLVRFDLSKKVLFLYYFGDGAFYL